MTLSTLVPPPRPRGWVVRPRQDRSRSEAVRRCAVDVHLSEPVLPHVARLLLAKQSLIDLLPAYPGA